MVCSAQNVLSKFNSQGLSNSIYALGLLGIIDQEFLKEWFKQASPKLSTFTSQGLSNSIYSLALLEEPLADKFQSLLLKAIENTIEENKQFDSRGIHQITLAKAYYNIKEAFLDGLIKKNRGKLEKYEDKTESKLQKSVVSILEKLDLGEIEVEYWVPEIASSVDAAIVEDKIAFEADGPTHFQDNSKEYNSSSNLKSTLLTERLKWTLVCIPYFEWDNLLKGEDKRKRHLENKLKEAKAKKRLKETEKIIKKDQSSKKRIK